MNQPQDTSYKNIAVLSYSYTGNNEALAKSVATELSAMHIKVSTQKPFKMSTLLLDMIFSRTPKVSPAPISLQKYDFILLVGPVWMGQVASPLRIYLNYIRQNPKPYGFLSISGGADKGNPKLSQELFKRTGALPVALIDLHIADLFSSKASVTRKDTSAYKINTLEAKILTDIAMEEIKRI
jgi:hypothetical protein